MTIREAIAAEIEPYALSDNAVEKAAITSFAKYDGTEVDVESDYTSSMDKSCGFAAMLLLSQLMTLTGENIGGISQSYKDNMADLRRMIKSIANRIGVSADLVLADDSDDIVTYCPVW